MHSNNKWEGGYTDMYRCRRIHRQQGDIISFLLFFLNKESRLKIMHFMEHSACMEEMRNIYEILVGSPIGNSY
jgi:hypothetical protein